MKEQGGGVNSRNTHINQDSSGKTEFQVSMVEVMIRNMILKQVNVTSLTFNKYL